MPSSLQLDVYGFALRRGPLTMEDVGVVLAEIFKYHHSPKEAIANVPHSQKTLDILEGITERSSSGLIIHKAMEMISELRRVLGMRVGDSPAKPH